MAEKLDMYVHVPRTGGTTLRNCVVGHHGADSVYMYAMTTDSLIRADRQVYAQENPRHVRLREIASRIPFSSELVMALRQRRAEDPQKALANASAIIGHYTVDRFTDEIGDSDERYLTLVRDPLDRMISHYRIANRSQTENPKKCGSWVEVGDATLPFDEFALSEPIKNFQTQYTGTEADRYDVLGTTENFARFLLRAGLSSIGSTAILNTSRPEGDEMARVYRDPGFINSFTEFHSEDYQFYTIASEQT